MRIKPLVVLLGFAAAGVCCVPARMQAAPAADAEMRCKALASADFSQLQDATTQILATTLTDSTGDASRYCEVSGYITPNVGFVVRLPIDRWNGKFIQMGCGGFCGSTELFLPACNDPLHRGYACIVSDNGHRSTLGDAKWAYNNLPAELDHAYRGAHVTALAGKAIVARYYGQPPAKSYFWGCSTGGRQALMEAQRFPWDFDGIIAGCPAIEGPALRMSLLWGSRALRDETGQPLLRHADIELLHRAVMAKCDSHDGLKDNLIADPLACDHDAAELRCTSSKAARCLTPQQIAAVRKIYSGPLTSKGEPIYMPGAAKGSELTWLGWFQGIDEFVAEGFRYGGFYPHPGPKWKPEELDFDRDYKRFGIAEGLYSPANPDLRRLKARGGKLLSYVGWNDAGGMPLAGVDYYETVERTMGGRAATQEFFRLFAVPGMNHCSGGDGAFAVDWLSALEAWVERGQAPERLIGSHVLLEKARDVPDRVQQLHLRFPLDPAKVEFSRPVYPYPLKTKYSGRGDPRDAGSFGPM